MRYIKHYPKRINTSLFYQDIDNIKHNIIMGDQFITVSADLKRSWEIEDASKDKMLDTAKTNAVFDIQSTRHQCDTNIIKMPNYEAVIALRNALDSAIKDFDTFFNELSEDATELA